MPDSLTDAINRSTSHTEIVRVSYPGDSSDLAVELDRYGPRAKNDDILDALADIYANGLKGRPTKDEKKVAKDPFVMESLLEQVGVFSRPHVVTNGPRRVHSVG